MLFVGTKEKGYAVEELASATKTEIEFTGYESHILHLRDKIIEKEYGYIIVDIEPFIDNYIVIATELKRLSKMTKDVFIIFAPGYNANSEIIQALAAQGFIYFVLSPILGSQREEIKNAFNGIKTELDINSDEETEENESVPSASGNSPLQKTNSIIAIAGCCPHIGTTTQAIQLVKYLVLNGHKACYVEMNDNRFVERLVRLYDVKDVDKDIGRASYENVDMFYKKENISEILRLDYDYFVYDCGSFTDKYFNSITFLEKSINIVVGGCKPNEIEYTQKVLANTLYNNTFYIFSFCPDNEKDDICTLMQEKADVTFFANYTPDCFVYSSSGNLIYSQIVQPKGTTKKENKRSIFSKKKK